MGQTYRRMENLKPYPAGTSPAVADPENFGGGGGNKNFKHKISQSSEIQRFFRPKIRWSPKKKKKKKKKKKVFTEIETDFSAVIVTFRLVGGEMHPPIPPPKSATVYQELW